MLGIGGGGDVVGALGVARELEALGLEVVLGGTTWERAVVDPRPGPRPMSEVSGGRQIAETALLADADTRTPSGVSFSEALVAAHLGVETVLIDPTRGPAAAAAGITEAAAHLGCDVVAYVDVGGDVLAYGHEEGLGSPLCDAVMLAAAVHASKRVPAIACVVGAGCDGELTPDEVIERFEELVEHDGWLGTIPISASVATEMREVARTVPTEASVQTARCALGERGEALIRGGLRRVQLTSHGGLAIFFDPQRAVRVAAPLTGAVLEAPSLEHARETLIDRGVSTELDFERKRGLER
ncbi:MAG: DUF1152 domain-containing protein [Solirubrobacterales bacterium]